MIPFYKKLASHADIMKHSILVLFILNLMPVRTFCQEKTIGLKIGDTVPNFRIPKIINYSRSSEMITEFTRDLLIIDFWSRGCKSCIDALPRMAKLENKFKDKLVILPVTYEKKSDIVNFWKNNKYTKHLKIPSVVEDKIFRNLFKHVAIPHEVWIYKGVVIAITPLDYVDEFNIKRVLTAKESRLDWPIKNDYLSYDQSKPVFSLISEQFDGIINRSYAGICKFKQGIGSPIYLTAGFGSVKDSIRRSVRTYFLNQPILNSYSLYFMSIFPPQNRRTPSQDLQPNQIRWDVKNKDKYRFSKSEGCYEQNWLITNGICFESIYPDIGQSDLQISQSAVLDLNRLLGLDVRWQEFNEKVWVLRKINGFVKKPHIAATDSSAIYSIYDIVKRMNEQELNPYIFDNTNDIKSVLTLDITSWTDIPYISSELERNGFELKEEFRIVDRLTFKEI